MDSGSGRSRGAHREVAGEGRREKCCLLGKRRAPAAGAQSGLRVPGRDPRPLFAGPPPAHRAPLHPLPLGPLPSASALPLPSPSLPSTAPASPPQSGPPRPRLEPRGRARAGPDRKRAELEARVRRPGTPVEIRERFRRNSSRGARARAAPPTRKVLAAVQITRPRAMFAKALVAACALIALASAVPDDAALVRINLRGERTPLSRAARQAGGCARRAAAPPPLPPPLPPARAGRTPRGTSAGPLPPRRSSRARRSLPRPLHRSPRTLASPALLDCVRPPCSRCSPSR